MRFVIFAETPDLQETCLPASVALKRVSKEFPIYRYENRRHILDVIEFNGSKAVKLDYSDRRLVINAPVCNNYEIALPEQPCLIVVHHWGRRGVTFEFNNALMNAVLLKIGLRRDWHIVSQNPCVAATSGGFDPIKELIHSFFYCRGNPEDKCCRIEQLLTESCSEIMQNPVLNA